MRTGTFSRRWKPRLACLLMMIVSGTEYTSASDDALESLDPLRWNHRVVLVHAPPDLAEHAARNLTALDDQIEDRDIAWFVLSDDGLSTNYPGPVGEGLKEWILERHFTPRPRLTGTVLIGKDGGVKSRGEDLDLESTFELIDSMPMRQAEMRRNNRP
ncbi:MAG: DUF4174 domain-containing protein [Gammaproteobacteria bacterium]|nr:DUF4174 domain-containing protein [Gammaproteobacteria bacterium]